MASNVATLISPVPTGQPSSGGRLRGLPRGVWPGSACARSNSWTGISKRSKSRRAILAPILRLPCQILHADRRSISSTRASSLGLVIPLLRKSSCKVMPSTISRRPHGRHSKQRLDTMPVKMSTKRISFFRGVAYIHIMTTLRTTNKPQKEGTMAHTVAAAMIEREERV
jgi:hypothetical protein